VQRIQIVAPLLISTIALVASLYQLRMASRSISAQTWPYVTLGWRYGVDEIGISVSNDGLGPALVRNVILTIDQKPQRDVVSALKLNELVRASGPVVSIDGLTRGIVIRAGNSVNAFSVHDPVSAKQLLSAKSRIDLQICYCSILGRCWTSSIADAIPQDVSSCPDNDRNGLVLPEP
jgi:hypothetical protein